MSGARVFVDTKVFAYALDPRDAAKQARAQEIISERRDDIVISTQVLIELYAVCTRKLGLSREQAQSALDAISGFQVLDADRSLVLEAARLATEAQISIFDAAVLCAAQRSKCPIILTEDLNAGQRFGEVLVEDPFVG